MRVWLDRARVLGDLRSPGARAARRQRGAPSGPGRTLADSSSTVSSASGWSHMKLPNSSSEMSATVSLPRLRLRARTRAPALPRSRRAEQYRRREAVPGSTQAGADVGNDGGTDGGTDVSTDGSIDGSIDGGALSDAIYIIL